MSDEHREQHHDAPPAFVLSCAFCGAQLVTVRPDELVRPWHEAAMWLADITESHRDACAHPDELPRLEIPGH